MCITRVGKVTAASQGRASVDFFDGRSLDGVDVSMVAATSGDFVEVFGNLALSVVSPSDAKKRRAAWKAVRKAAIVALPKRAKAR
jgi:hydrogenase maturation factor